MTGKCSCGEFSLRRELDDDLSIAPGVRESSFNPQLKKAEAAAEFATAFPYVTNIPASKAF